MMTTAMMTAAVMSPVSPMSATTLNMLSGAGPADLAAALALVAAAVLAVVGMSRYASKSNVGRVAPAAA